MKSGIWSIVGCRWWVGWALLVAFTINHQPSTALAGYTIFTRPHVSPQFITVHGAEGPELRLNPGQPVSYPAGIGRVVCRSAGFNPYSSAAKHRQEVFENGTATDAEVFTVCPGLKAEIRAEITEIRKQALDRITLNSGVLAVYSENYAAATAYKAGNGATTVMKDGQSATAYLTGMGSQMTPPLTVDQFASYIISENRRVGPTAYDVEQQYLWFAYTVVTGEQSVSELRSLPEQYRRYCGL